MLKLHGVAKNFGGLQVLRDIDLEIAKGELTGLIGPNGAGKTTLFNIMTGFLLPSAGSLSFEGNDIVGVPPHELAARGLVRTFQGARTFPKLTVRESLQIAQHLRTEAGSAMSPQTRDAMSALHLEAYADEPANSLPSGLMRTLGIAMAIATGARMLLLDEPAAGLSAEEIGHLRDVIIGVNQAGITVCVIEHNLNFLMGCVGRAVVLDAGILIADGTPAEVTRNPRVIEAYLGVEDHAGS